MKLNKLFPIIIAILALMTSCADEATMTLLDEIQVSSSYVSIPLEGGSKSVTFTTKDNWTVEKVVSKKDSLKWLTISSTSGVAGESTLTFTAPSAIDGRSAEVLIINREEIQTKDSIIIKKTIQRINIIQGLSKISDAKVAVVNAGPDGKTYRLKGVVTSIVNTDYGNWYLTDETGSMYIYGTLDKKGAEKNFKSLNIEVGDEVTVEGPKSSYNGVPQMVKVMVISVNKSLIKVDSVANGVLPLEGGDFTAYVSVKGQGVSVDIPENAKSWLSISSIQSAGTNAVVKFKAAANTGGDRKTTIIFRTTDGSKDYSTETTLNQKGAIIKATIAEFNAAAVGDFQYRLTGIISKISDEAKGRFYLKDFSGETYVYGIQDFTKKGLKLGDIVTIVGKRAEYKGPQVAGAVLENVIHVTPVTIAELLTKADSKEIYYMVTGKIAEITNPVYGNHYLEDGGSKIEVYGTHPGYGATGDFRKNLFVDKGFKVGDQLTLIGTRGSFGEKAQLNGIYFSHKSAE